MVCTHRLKSQCGCPPEAKKLTGGASPWSLRHKAKEAQKLATKEFGQKLLLALDTDRALILQQFRILDAKDNFADFCRQAWHVVEPATELQWNWHHTLLCNVLQALFESWLRAGEIKGYEPPVLNTAISICPGALKSKITLVFFPVWIWIRSPGVKFVCLSVNEEVALRDARASRDLLRSDWLLNNFNPKFGLKGDQDAISNYGNTAGGERLSKPSGSAVVGLRGDLLLYDDPNSPDENMAEREHINRIWDDSIYSRVNSGSRSMRIGIQQRVGVGDWTEHVMKKQGTWSPDNTGGWMNVVLPAEFEVERRFVMPEPLADLLRKKLGNNVIVADPRKVEGQSIHRERFSAEYLERERRRWEGTGNYASQYQQRPALLGGNLIKRRYWSWFRLDGGVRPEFDEVPKGRPRPAECPGDAVLIKAKHMGVGPGHWDFDWICISIDCAVRKTEKGSNWGMVAMAGKSGRRYVLDDRTRRGSIIEIIETLRAMIKLWKPDKILIERKAASEDLKLRLLGEMQKGDMPMVVLEEVEVGNLGKEERLTTCLPTIANGMVHLLDGAAWLEEFVDEFSVFPNGARDDRIDSVSQCLNYYYQPLEDDIGLPDW